MEKFQNLKFTVNGNLVEVIVSPDELLIDVLREKLLLTGTKKGCGIGECGACTVLLEGKPVCSCLLPAMKVQNKEITTIEGLESTSIGRKLQESFINHGAVQCGFCTPGMLMAAKGYLDKNLNPNKEDISKAISGNLCRCTGYKKIIEAIYDVVIERYRSEGDSND